MKRQWNRVLAGTLAMSMLALSGCASSSAPASTGVGINVICKSQDPYWDTTKAGANDAAEEMGLTVLYDAPETEDMLDAQIAMIESAIESGTKGIVVAPLDTDALNDVLARATEAGIPVVTIDSDVSYEGRSSCLSTQNYSAGAIAARYAASLLGEKGDVAIITHSETAQTAVERAGGFEDEISGSSKDVRISVKDKGSEDEAAGAAPATLPSPDAPADGAAPATLPSPDAPADGAAPNPDEQFPRGVPQEAKAQMSDTSAADSLGYPDIHITETKLGGGDVQVSRESAIQLIKENPNLKLIYTTNQPGTVGACEAIKELGMQDKVQLVGFDYFDGADEYINSGVLDAVVTQNPYNMGYLGVRYAYKLFSGETVKRTIDTGATLVTPDNLNDEDIRFLVDPTGKNSKEGQS